MLLVMPLERKSEFKVVEDMLVTMAMLMGSEGTKALPQLVSLIYSCAAWCIPPAVFSSRHALESAG